MVAVRDNGIGIDAAMLDSIFDRFVQERQALSRSQGGLGLGLTIARSMVVLHGGSIGVHSAGAGRGSTFTVRLPLLAEARHQPDAHPPALAPATANASGADAQAGLRILVVDDNEDAACALGELLTLKGHTVHVAFGAPEALQRQPLFLPQVCLLDIGLPGMDGYELAQRLRQQGAGRALALVAITGYGQDSDRRRAADAGFDHHLTKPVDLAALDALLRRAP